MRVRYGDEERLMCGQPRGDWGNEANAETPRHYPKHPLESAFRRLTRQSLKIENNEVWRAETKPRMIELAAPKLFDERNSNPLIHPGAQFQLVGDVLHHRELQINGSLRSDPRIQRREKICQCADSPRIFVALVELMSKGVEIDGRR